VRGTISDFEVRLNFAKQKVFKYPSFLRLSRKKIISQILFFLILDFIDLTENLFSLQISFSSNPQKQEKICCISFWIKKPFTLFSKQKIN